MVLHREEVLMRSGFYPRAAVTLASFTLALCACPGPARAQVTLGIGAGALSRARLLDTPTGRWTVESGAVLSVEATAVVSGSIIATVGYAYGFPRYTSIGYVSDTVGTRVVAVQIGYRAHLRRGYADITAGPTVLDYRFHLLDSIPRNGTYSDRSIGFQGAMTAVLPIWSRVAATASGGVMVGRYWPEVVSDEAPMPPAVPVSARWHLRHAVQVGLRVRVAG